jgi:hypothetical protein
VQVVAELGRRRFDSADGDDQLAGLAGLDDIVERVVLEDHRQRGVGGKVERVPKLWALGEQAAERDREVVFGGDVDLQVRRAKRAIDGSKAAQQVLKRTEVAGYSNGA